MSASYAYNGDGNRLQQTANSVTTTYVMDLNAGLAQVLDDGTNQYIYGNGRIAQVNATTQYFLDDALGSVRQITNANGVITLAQSYDPYGTVNTANGAGASSYGFTGEYTDPTGMVYLRARHYNPGMGRFISRDTWNGSISRPVTYNRWAYANANPVMFKDPTGLCVPITNAETRSCTAERGDYLSIIGDNYGVSYHDMVVWHKTAYGNDTNENIINVGQTIYLEDPSLALQIVPIPSHSGNRWNGYVEGNGGTSTLAFFILDAAGEEMVYDFETLQAAKFTYTGRKIFGFACGLSTNTGSLSRSSYTGFFHFPAASAGDLAGTYGGPSMGLSASFGVGLSIFDGTPLGQYALGGGITSSFGLETGDGLSHNPEKSGVTISINQGASLPGGLQAVRWPVEVDEVFLDYTPGEVTQYYSAMTMAMDIIHGTGTELGGAGGANPIMLASRFFFAKQLLEMYTP